MKTQLVILTIVIGLVSSGIAHAKEKAKAPVVVRDETDLLQFGWYQSGVDFVNPELVCS